MVTFSLLSYNSLKTNSSNGNLLKWELKTGDEYKYKTLFIKTSSYNEYRNTWMFDSISEVIVSKLANEILNLNKNEIVDYNLCNIIIDNQITTLGCYSKSFINNDEQYITIGKLMNNPTIFNLLQDGNKSSYNNLLQIMKQELGINNAQHILNNTLLLDYITLNTDRHFGNLGIIHSQQGKNRTAPIFDNG